MRQLLRLKNTHTLTKIALLVSLAALLDACDKPPEPGASGSTSAPSTATSKPSAAATQTAKPAAGPGEIAWDVPAKWKQIPNPNSMRLATYLIPRADGDPDDGEMSVTRVGGGVEQNLQRWQGQFNPAKPDTMKKQERTIAGLRVTLFEIAGTYAGMAGMGQPNQPKENHALLAAIVEANGEPWFFKLTGPEKTLAAARADFDSLVNSFKPK